MSSRIVGPVIAVAIVLAVIVILATNLQTGPVPAQAPEPAVHAAMHSEDPGSAQRFMPMVAKDGPHYGKTYRMPGHGKYRLIYTIYPPDPNQFGRHTDAVTGVGPWWEPFDVEFEFDYQGIPADEEGKGQTVAGVPFREYFIGKQESHHMEIQAVWLPPVQMEGMELPQDPDVIHLEADIHALAGHPNGFALGDWVPYLRVEFELIPIEEN